MAKEHSFLPDSINLIADQCEVPIDSDASLELAKDAAFRIEQIVDRAVIFMRRANRHRLTCDDINRSLRWFNCQQTYGYSCKPDVDLRYSYIKPANVYVYDEKIVDLMTKSTSPPQQQSEVLEPVMSVRIINYDSSNDFRTDKIETTNSTITNNINVEPTQL